MKGEQVKAASVDNLRSLAGKGRQDVRIVAMKDIDPRESFLGWGRVKHVKYCQEGARRYRGKGGNGGLNLPITPPFKKYY